MYILARHTIILVVLKRRWAGPKEVGWPKWLIKHGGVPVQIGGYRVFTTNLGTSLRSSANASLAGNRIAGGPMT